MIEIDGNYGSGGGQILRTAAGLAALTEKPCRVFNIRAQRQNPGLRQQHLQAVKAVSAFCSGKLEGAEIGSKEIVFYPGKISKKEVSVHISTAGSVGLVLQALLLPASTRRLKIKINGGGTYGKWAPPVAYLQNILQFFLAQMGYGFEIKVLREGFFPKGGAEVEVNTQPAKWKPIEALERGGILAINAFSAASLSLKEERVAERQVESARKILYQTYKLLPEAHVSYSPALCAGSGLHLYIDTGYHMRVGADAVGELGRRAEDVGADAARKLVREYESGGVDSHAADQLLPYMALAGGKIKVSQVTPHCRTNAFVVEKFLPVKFKIEDKLIEAVKEAR